METHQKQGTQNYDKNDDAAHVHVQQFLHQHTKNLGNIINGHHAIGASWKSDSIFELNKWMFRSWAQTEIKWEKSSFGLIQPIYCRNYSFKKLVVYLLDVWGAVQTSQYACRQNKNTRHTNTHTDTNTQIHGTTKYVLRTTTQNTELWNNNIAKMILSLWLYSFCFSTWTTTHKEVLLSQEKGVTRLRFWIIV